MMVPPRDACGEVCELDVVIATNRRSPYLEQALVSVQAQVGARCHVAVVDDGSPAPADIRSATANIANVTVIRQSAAGVSAARNRGMREGNAPFVAFLDDDDAWLPSKSARQLAALASDPEAVACACDGWYVDTEDRPVGTWSPVGRYPSRDYFSGRVPLPRLPTMVYRRSTCEEVGGFDETLSMGEDHEFNYRMLTRGTFAVVEERLVRYRMHPGNASQTPAAAIIARENSAQMFRQLITLCEQRGQVDLSALLSRQYAMRRNEWCLRSLRQINQAARRRDRSELVLELRWLASHGRWALEAAPTVWAHLGQR